MITMHQLVPSPPTGAEAVPLKEATFSASSAIANLALKSGDGGAGSKGKNAAANNNLTEFHHRAGINKCFKRFQECPFVPRKMSFSYHQDFSPEALGDPKRR